MSSPWHFGNTTVRNPLRIRDGLIVLKQALNGSLNGNLIGNGQERLFADELDRAGVIHIANKERDYSDMGRKWRACFSHLGFITDKFKRNLNPWDKDPTILQVAQEYPEYQLSGHAYEITPSGHRMIQAKTIQEQQECMLRTLLAYEIPSVVETHHPNQPFKPFVFILEVLHALASLENPQGLSKVEMAVLQAYRDHDRVDEVVAKILKHRSLREAASGRVQKQRVDHELLEEVANQNTSDSSSRSVKPSTWKDYADVNFRYPRLTGLVSLKGQRLVLAENKRSTVNALIGDKQLIGKDRPLDYLSRLWNGAELPTDDALTAREEALKFRRLLMSAGLDETAVPSIPDTNVPAELNQVRLRLEVLYHHVLESRYAAKQREPDQVRETIAYLKKLDKQSYDRDTYDITIDDEPAYLEWAVWRAFLTMNDLVNEPHKARRFNVDQDFFPLSCAPGGGPDMIFEFEDYVLVVEVTLTTSSRQEAAEGEPVRRHVANEKVKVEEESGKPVYGLFLARAIDNNTAETFRIGVWYRRDEPEFLNIVPMTLSQFIGLMEKYVQRRFDNKHFRRLLDTCLIPRNAHAPAWLKEIDKVIDGFLRS